MAQSRTIPMLHEIAKGTEAGKKAIHTSGYNVAIGDVLADLTESGEVVIPEPAAAVAMFAVSSHVNDVGTVLSSGLSTGGSATSLIHVGATFATDTVAAGDLVLNDDDVVFGLVASLVGEEELVLEYTNGTSFSGKNYRVVTNGNVGASVVEFHNLDGNFDEKDQFVVLNGTTAVALVGTDLRSNNMHVMHVGTNGVAVGNLSLQNAGATDIYNRIGAGGNMTLQSHYTVPRGKTGNVVSWSAGLVTSNKNTIGRAILRATVDFADRVTLPGVYHFHDIFAGQNGSTEREFKLPFKVPEKASVKVSAQRVVGAADLVGTSSIQLWLEDNPE